MEILKKIFPHLESKFLSSMLDQCRGNIYNVVDRLLVREYKAFPLYQYTNEEELKHAASLNHQSMLSKEEEEVPPENRYCTCYEHKQNYCDDSVKKSERMNTESSTISSFERNASSRSPQDEVEEELINSEGMESPRI